MRIAAGLAPAPHVMCMSIPPGRRRSLPNRTWKKPCSISRRTCSRPHDCPARSRFCPNSTVSSSERQRASTRMTLQQMFARKGGSRLESVKVAERVKIYGERKTGTTFLTDLIRRNFSIPLLSGTPDRPNRVERERLLERVADRSSGVRRIVLDRISDQENRRALPDTLGWK